MKIIIVILFSVIDLGIFAQSSITFDAGSSIDIQTGADVCADVITVNGTYSGGGTICSGALPVTLSLFNAKSDKNNVTLYWKTEAELNNAGFDIERKTETGTWQKIGFAAGNGTTNNPSEYYYTDKMLMPGTYYYRLKQIDFNGNYEYFALALPVIISKPAKFEISQNYPNPSNPNSRIDYQVPELVNVNITVYDMLGREVAVLVNEMKEPGIYTAVFDGANISSGTYFYLIKAGDFKQIKKLILVK